MFGIFCKIIHNTSWVLQLVSKMIIVFFLLQLQLQVYVTHYIIKGHCGAMWHYGFATIVDITT